MYKFQRTISRKIQFSGIGLHTGANTNIVLYPAKENSGIIFKRTDINEDVYIDASIENVIETKRGTTIGAHGHKIYTIEHLLSALIGLGIDNVYIDIDNIEPPIFDGSSKIFVDKIIDANIVKLNCKKKYLNVLEEIKYSDDSCNIKIVPYDGFKISYYANFSYGNIGEQEFSYILGKNYIQEIANARTFCSIGELIFLKENNLIKGADLNSGIVFLDDKINIDEIKKILLEFNLEVNSLENENFTLNNIPLRYSNEPIRHKILDLLGDFLLLGYSLKGHIISYGGGHKSNVELMKRIRNIYG